MVLARKQDIHYNVHEWETIFNTTIKNTKF